MIHPTHPARNRAFYEETACDGVRASTLRAIHIKRPTGHTHTHTTAEYTTAEQKPLTRTQSEQRRNDA